MESEIQEIINSIRNTGIEITDMTEYVENKDTLKTDCMKKEYYEQHN